MFYVEILNKQRLFRKGNLFSDVECQKSSVPVCIALHFQPVICFKEKLFIILIFSTTFIRCSCCFFGVKFKTRVTWLLVFNNEVSSKLDLNRTSAEALIANSKHILTRLG